MFNADGQSDITKLLVNIRNSVKVPIVIEFYLLRFKEGVISDIQALSENTEEQEFHFICSHVFYMELSTFCILCHCMLLKVPIFTNLTGRIVLKTSVLLHASYILN